MYTDATFDLYDLDIQYGSYLQVNQEVLHDDLSERHKPYVAILQGANA